MYFQLTDQMFEILNHSQTRAARGLYCGDSPAMQALVRQGLMQSAGKVSWCPDEYFRLTNEGRGALAIERVRRAAFAELKGAK